MDPSGNSKNVYLRESPLKGTQIIGAKVVRLKNFKDTQKILEHGQSRRVTKKTMANDTSSRSHVIFQITVETGKTRAKLNLIDLAGSERGSKTQNRGIRLREGSKINRSLLALANCINALSSKTKNYVPYRDSKLTRLLKDSLEGEFRSVMICNISPSS